jgi:hypothetical protein
VHSPMHNRRRHLGCQESRGLSKLAGLRLLNRMAFPVRIGQALVQAVPS